MTDPATNITREWLLHALYEAAELEHNLMCTYLYAAFSLKSGVEEGLTAFEANAVKSWRQRIIGVAVDEMRHLAAVWNVTAALGGSPRFGRTNFPLDPGFLPAGVVVKLAPFSEAVVQHFIHLERPAGSAEPDGEGFAPERRFVRAATGARLTPMGVDYATVGEFYGAIANGLRSLVMRVGESATFSGDPALQLSASEIDLPGANRVICLKTALAAFDAIVLQGEGASETSAGSHFDTFCQIRREHCDLRAANPAFVAAYPAATNPVLRRPPRPEGRVWIEDEAAIATVDLANAAYGTMLRLLAHAYSVPSSDPAKSLAVDLGLGLMRVVTLLGERAARLPAGPSNPHCNAGMSFTTLRDAAALPAAAGAGRFFSERVEELADAAAGMVVQRPGDVRLTDAARALAKLAQRATHGLQPESRATSPPTATHRSLSAATQAVQIATATQSVDGIEVVEGTSLTLMFEGQRCIHARFCVTGAPTVFLANVQGPWLHPDTLDVDRLTAIAEACPSGAIRYRRKDGRPDEGAPPVNLLAVREAGPYALRGRLRLASDSIGFRATLCRCGASKNKPFCDGSHHDAQFAATGEPPVRSTDMLAVRDGPLQIDPQPDGPLQLRGNLEITSGTGRVVARVTSARLCRCGASGTKPFCDGSHGVIGFRS